LAKEKAEKIISRKQQKKKDIEHLIGKISQKKILIKDFTPVRDKDCINI
jgi:hypothetical protein